MDEERLSDECGRLAALKRLAILDTGQEAEYEHITRLARTVLDVPVAAVSLIDDDRQWFKAIEGVDLCQTSREASFCSVAIQRREPLLVEDALQDPRFSTNPLVTAEPHIRSYLGVPLVLVDGFQVGALCGMDFRPRTFSEPQVAAMRNLALCVEKEFELRLKATRDDLTGFKSRAAFFDKLERARGKVVAGKCPATLALLDLDHFKTVNDTHGHDAGDAVLRHVAALCADRVGYEAHLGRIGGEEFALLFPGATADEVAPKLESLREAVAAMQIPGHPQLRITVSGGLCQLRPTESDVVAAFKRADAALYAAKAEGRDRIRHAPALEEPPETSRSLPHLWRMRARAACEDAATAATAQRDLAVANG